MSGDLLHARRARGAFLNGAPLPPPPSAVVRPRVVLAHEDRDRALGLASATDLLALGSTALKIGAVARGAADGYLSRGRKEIWDVAGGAVIAREAGAEVFGLDGRPLDPREGGGPYPGVLVVGGWWPDGRDYLLERSGL
jgi:myo-inositol-1(or 4)-monophosphatase